MALEFGCSNRGKPTVIYRYFEYIKDCDNVCGTTSWGCCLYQQMKCKVRLVTSSNRVVSNRQPDHTHTGNVAKALACKAVDEMKQVVGTMNVASRSAQELTASPAVPIPWKVGIMAYSHSSYAITRPCEPSCQD